ncbi:hypothetical protein TNCV_1860841 [Trichonephila clavipes]|nr:hypothetical protein TNCV_1860841 [Trichonephila clavipes]
MPSPVQFNCDAHDTIANGQYGAVWSMGHTQQACVRIFFLPSNVWAQFFGRSAFLRQQETDLSPAELCPSSVSWGKLLNRTTQPTSRIRTLTSTFAGLMKDMCTNDSLAANKRIKRSRLAMAWSTDCFDEP